MDDEHINRFGGTAMAGELIAFNLIGVLKAKGILSTEETVAFYENVLQAMERYPKNDPMVGEARKIIDQMAQIAATAPKGTGAPPSGRSSRDCPHLACHGASARFLMQHLRRIWIEL